MIARPPPACTPASEIEGLIEARDEELARLAKALAHPARVRILRLLAARATCIAGDLVDELGLAQSTVSEHLRLLKEAGLIRGEIERPRICYGLEPATLARLQHLVGGLRPSDASATNTLAMAAAGRSNERNEPMSMQVPLSLTADAVGELVAIGAAVAANCEPCLRHHVGKARELGLSTELMRDAVATAQRVKDAPRRTMRELAEELLSAETADCGCGPDCCALPAPAAAARCC